MGVGEGRAMKRKKQDNSAFLYVYSAEGRRAPRHAPEDAREPKDLGIPLWISLLPGAEGDDGLTHWERKWLGMQYRREVMRPLNEAEKKAIRKWQDTKEDKK